MKKITIKFNILTLLILFVVVIAIVFIIKTHAVQNLFFQSLRPWMIEKVTLCVDRNPARYAELTDSQISELVALLNNVRLSGEGVRTYTPSEVNKTGYHIHLITGQTFILTSLADCEVAVGSYVFINAGENSLDIAKLRNTHLLELCPVE